LPLATFALLWTFLFLIPAIAGLAIFPVGEWIHDRYLYLPSFGLCLYLGFLIGRLRSEQKLFGLPALSTTAAMMLAAILSFGTAWQQQFWANSLVLYVHAVNEAPQNPWPKGYLAGELLRRGDRMNARRMYEAALALDPKNWKNNVAYGLMLYDEHDYRGADEYITRALNGDPSDPNAHFDQGLSRLNYGNYASAESSFREAVRRNPSLPEVHYWLGVCLENQGKLNEARSEYQSEFQLHPNTTTNAEQRFRELAPK
jgi:Tfp pilus assembly protein PilF